MASWTADGCFATETPEKISITVHLRKVVLGRLMYWVGPKVHSGFSTSFRKTWTNLRANPVLCGKIPGYRISHILVKFSFHVRDLIQQNVQWSLFLLERWLISNLLLNTFFFFNLKNQGKDVPCDTRWLWEFEPTLPGAGSPVPRAPEPSGVEVITVLGTALISGDKKRKT